MAAKNIDLMTPREKKFINDKNANVKDFLIEDLEKQLNKAISECVNLKQDSKQGQEYAKLVAALVLPNGLSLFADTLLDQLMKIRKCNRPMLKDVIAFAELMDDKKVEKVDAAINASDIFKGITAIGEKK